MSASHDSPGYSPKIYYVECVSSLAAGSLFVRRLVIYRTVLEGVLQRAAATVRVNGKPIMVVGRPVIGKAIRVLLCPCIWENAIKIG